MATPTRTRRLEARPYCRWRPLQCHVSPLSNAHQSDETVDRNTKYVFTFIGGESAHSVSGDWPRLLRTQWHLLVAPTGFSGVAHQSLCIVWNHGGIRLGNLR